MNRLRTSYLGLELPHPVVASAGPLSGTLDGIRRLEDAGAAAIVLPSLFEEQIRAFETPHSGRVAARALDTPGFRADDLLPDSYLELVRRARETASAPIIASLNGATADAWTSYARSLQEAGANALELNVFHVPADLAVSGEQVERRLRDVVRAVRATITIPLSVKIGPFFSAPGEMARRLAVAGADGLVLFNRFYQPDIDIDTIAWTRSANLSVRQEVRLPLVWIALLHGRLPVSLAATTGVETAVEVIKYVLAGADAVMTTSALLRHGPSHASVLAAGLAEFLDRSPFASVTEMKGALSRGRNEVAEGTERNDYMGMLAGYAGDWQGWTK